MEKSGVEAFYSRAEATKKFNIMCEKKKFENSRITQIREQNPELSVVEAGKEIRQQDYNQTINEIVNKIQTEIPSTRRANVVQNQSNTSVEVHTVNNGTTQ